MSRNDDHRTALDIADTFVCEDADSKTLPDTDGCYANTLAKLGRGKSFTLLVKQEVDANDHCVCDSCPAFDICNRVWSEGDPS